MFGRTNLSGSLILSVFLAITAMADAPASATKLPADISKYAVALDEFQKQHERGSIEPVYAVGIIAAEKLLPVLESLSVPEYNEAKGLMKGFKINRQEVIFAEPDSLFFKMLAEQKGQAVDAEFFGLLYQTKSGAWPAYIRQETDYSGCIKFGSGILADLYGKWSKFRRSHPTAYTSHVKKQIDDIEEVLTLRTEQACGATNNVIRELQLFVKSYPNAGHHWGHVLPCHFFAFLNPFGTMPVFPLRTRF